MNDLIFDSDKKPNDYYASDRCEMLKFIPQGVAQVLEVGCGEGAFGSSLKSRCHAQVWGMEVLQEAAQVARKRLDKVIVGDVENEMISLPENFFDCIVCNDVLEHLRYPWIVLEKFKSKLRDGGCIVASIPNVRYYYNIYDLIKNKEWSYVDQGILDKTHLRFFTIKSIQKMFEDCGYQVITIKGISVCQLSWKFKILNWMMHNSFDDMKFLRFACVAQKRT